MNTLHKEEYDKLTGPFKGDPAHVYVRIENETSPEDAAAQVQEEEKDVDPLEDTPPEDPNKGVVRRSLTEEDRLLYTVLAIENDC